MLLLLPLFGDREESKVHEKSSRVAFTGVAALCNTTDGSSKLLALETLTAAVVVMFVHAATSP